MKWAGSPCQVLHCQIWNYWNRKPCWTWGPSTKTDFISLLCIYCFQILFWICETHAFVGSMFMILSLSLINGFSSAVCHSVAVSSFSIFPRPQISEFLCSWVLLLLCVSANEVKPDFYYLEDQDKEDDVCLATSFTRHNAVTSQQDFKGFNETKPTMITEFGGVYNQVAFLKEQEKGKCQGEGLHVDKIK